MYIDRQLAYNELFGLVGFYQPTDPNLPSLLPSLVATETGQHYNDAHPLLTIDNIFNSATNYTEFNYPIWGATTEYDLGQKVKSPTDSKNYEAKVNLPAVGSDPSTNASDWQEIDEFNDYLIRAVHAGIDAMLDKYMNMKKHRGATKSIFENIYLFNGAANRNNEVNNENRMVGLKLRIRKREQHIVTILNSIGIQLSGAVTDLPIYLYHSSQVSAPKATFNISTTGRDFKWLQLATDNILRYVEVEGDQDAGGDWFICYRQSDLEAQGVKAINKNVDWDTAPCAGCDDVWRDYYKQYSKYIDVQAFSIEESKINGLELWELDDATYNSVYNYGLNLGMTSRCDILPFLFQEKKVLAEALKMNVAFWLMEQMASNVRGTNQQANQVKQMAMKQVFHHKEAYGTLADRTREAMKGFSFDFSGMHNGCLPSDLPRGLRMKAHSV